jgi:hypothetical protein
MGKGERSRAETQTHYVSISPQEDRSISAGKVGEVEGATEEGCLEPAEPAASIRPDSTSHYWADFGLDFTGL